MITADKCRKDPFAAATMGIGAKGPAHPWWEPLRRNGAAPGIAGCMYAYNDGSDRETQPVMSARKGSQRDRSSIKDISASYRSRTHQPVDSGGYRCPRSQLELPAHSRPAEETRAPICKESGHMTEPLPIADPTDAILETKMPGKVGVKEPIMAYVRSSSDISGRESSHGCISIASIRKDRDDASAARPIFSAGARSCGPGRGSCSHWARSGRSRPCPGAAAGAHAFRQRPDHSGRRCRSIA